MEKKSNKRALFVILLLVLLPALFIGGCLLIKGAFAPKIDKVSVNKLPNGHFQLLVGKEPYLIKGVCYQPIAVGQDYAYDFWGDAAKPWLVDGKLMREMGINTVRFYQPGRDPQEVKRLIGDLYKEFNIRTIMGHTLGVYDFPPPNYADEDYCLQMKEQVLGMVSDYKDEPGILLWLLGNENNYSLDEETSRVYYSFINDLAKEIHKLDPNHPVVMGNGETFYLEIAREAAPEVDILGGIFYRGISFGNAWQQIQDKFGKPVVLIEFGCDRYNALTKKEDEDMQAKFLESQWKEIIRNSYGMTGKGIALGGCIFEWTDEWWKHDSANPASWFVQDEEAGWSNGAYYFDIEVEGHLNMNEEWYGIVGLSPEKESGINKRVPKKAYYVLKALWSKSPQEIVQSQRGIKINQ
jgi:hypothetical protein